MRIIDPSIECKMRRHAMMIAQAAVLCVLLSSGHLAAEKTFGGGGGGYGGLEAGGDQQPAAEAATTAPSEPAPSTPAAESTGGQYETQPSSSEPAVGGGEAASTGGEAAAAASGGEAGYTGGGVAASTGGAAAAGGDLDPDGDPEVGLNDKVINEIVNEHNKFRAKEHVPPLTWNATLAKWSQQYAATLGGDCQQIHSSSPYGENLMWGSSALTWKLTVDGWSEEKKNYHYNTNTCDPGKMCGHYTAVVWKTTTSVGCGRIKCNNADEIIMCSYWPPGNYDGVKPY